MPVFAVSITPFGADGALDETGLRSHIHRVAAAGVGVYVGGGGSGEGYTLSPDETRRVLEVAAAALPSVRAMGVEPRSADQMIDYLRTARDAGVGAAQVYSLDPGHGHRPTREEVRRYLLDVLEATELDVVLSTHQSVGYRLAPDVLDEVLDQFPRVVGINCTHPDLGYLARVLDVAANRAPVYVGGPGQGLAALALGADGFLCSEANLAPRLCARVVDAFGTGDLEECFGAFGAVLRLSAALYERGGIRATKAVLAALGLPAGRVRPPQLGADAGAVADILQLLEALGVPAIEGWASHE